MRAVSDTTAPPRVWHTHAARGVHNLRWVYEYFGNPTWIRICYPNHTPVAVTLAEDPAGSHWGWIRTDTDEPTMIRASRHQFEAQFTYGWQAEEKAGRGRMVRLRVEEDQ